MKKSTQISLLMAALWLGASLPNGAAAQVYRCVGADGAVTLGDRPCVSKSGEPLKDVPTTSSTGVVRGTYGNPVCDADAGRYGGSSSRSRYESERYRQECWGEQRVSDRKSREAKVQREFADQSCAIKQRAVQDGFQKRDTFSDADRRAFDRMAADVARGC